MNPAAPVTSQTRFSWRRLPDTTLKGVIFLMSPLRFYNVIGVRVEDSSSIYDKLGVPRNQRIVES